MIDFSSITFIWPMLLWLLLLLPVLASCYVFLQSRGSRAGGRRLILEFVDEPATALATGGAAAVAAAAKAASTPSGMRRWRRHVPPLLTLLALTVLLVAIARPQGVILLPSRVETIMLAIDHSGSMRATDVKPTRMAAAKEAARAFIEDQPRQMRVGLVGIAGAAAVVQSPTTNREDLAKAVDRLQPQRGTALAACRTGVDFASNSRHGMRAG